MKPLFITAMHGMGDAVYQRPFIRAQSLVRPVYVSTPWPEIYADLPNVFPVKVASPYRAQAKNIARLKDFAWAKPPAVRDLARFTYGITRRETICENLERRVELAGQPFVFDLPDFGPSPVRSRKPIAVIRPVTIRAEWKNHARSPLPEYVEEAARILRSDSYHVVAIADLEGTAETLKGQMPEADEYFVHGELPGKALFALMQHAAVIVGGSGFIVPFALAFRTPLVMIGGGQGGYNAPEVVTDPRMDLRLFRAILPDRFCRCKFPQHACDKEISDFPQRFHQVLSAVTPQWQEVAA